MDGWDGRTGAGQVELERVVGEEEVRWRDSDNSSRIGEWADRNKWGIVIGSWVTGMGVSSAIISRNK
jgi:hypothetical protein